VDTIQALCAIIAHLPSPPGAVQLSRFQQNSRCADPDDGMPGEGAERGTRGKSCSVAGIPRSSAGRLFVADALWVTLAFAV
jgi:hypothetical protein